MEMWLSYLRIALRNLRRKWLFSFINISGLAIGISASVLIVLFVQDEFSYDNFHSGADRVYRVNIKARVSGQDIESAASCPPMAAALRNEFPEVEDALRLAIWRDVPVIQEEMAFTEKKILLADSNFFSFFEFPLISGDPKAFAGPNKIVLNEKMAEKYFGDKEPIGQHIEIGTSRFNCEVVGIVHNNPSNSHIQYDMIMSMDTWENSKQPYWVNNFLYTYFRVVENTDLDQTRGKFDDLVTKYVGPEAEAVFGTPIDEYKETNDFYYGYTLTPLRDIHLRSKLVGEMNPAGNIQYSYIFMMIASFIIIIALINFINLFTAHSAKKSREVGIRKTVGALKERLIAQFMTESILHAFFAMLIAGAIIHLTIGAFNSIAEKEVVFNALKQPWIIPGLLIMSVGIGLLAGVYPSFYLSSFQPAKVLRGETKSGRRSGKVRKYLVILQYAISTGLILATLVIYNQLILLQEKNLGFEKEQILVIENCWSLDKNKKSFKDQLLTFPFVESVSYTSHLPPYVDNSSLFRAVGADMDDQLLHHYWTDPDHKDVLQFELTQGRYFSEEFPSDSIAIILNETALKSFGWESIEGHQVIDFNQDSLPTIRNLIGVVKDFNFSSLHQDILPMAILPGDFGNLVAVKVIGEDYASMISSFEKNWKEHTNGAPFDFFFLNQNFDTLYRAEQRTSRVVLLFTVLAVIIASLGLFGLASYSADRRTHEIGIRKVMGASSFDIVSLLNRDFLKLVFYGMLISIPIAIPLLNKWLNNFNYRINITWDIFVITGLIALLLALFTISIKAIRTSLINPSQAIKVE